MSNDHLRAKIAAHRAIDAFAAWLDSQPDAVLLEAPDMMAALTNCPRAVAAMGRALSYGASAAGRPSGAGSPQRSV